MIRSVTNTKTLTAYAVGDTVVYKPFDWVPAKTLTVTKATFFHEQFSRGAYWELVMVDPVTGTEIKEQGHRVKKAA